MKNPFFCWHQWGKWGTQKLGTKSGVWGIPKLYQIRTCEKCGKMKIREIQSMSHLEKGKE